MFDLSNKTNQDLIVRAGELSAPLFSAIRGDIVFCGEDDAVHSKGDVSWDFGQSDRRDSFISRFLPEATAVWKESQSRSNRPEIEQVFAACGPVLQAIRTGSFPALDKKIQEEVVFNRKIAPFPPLKNRL